MINEILCGMKKKVPGESREDKFRRIASYRANKILHYIRLLGNCSNKNMYRYTKSQVDHIFSAVEKELRLSKSRFNVRKEYEIEL
jgi:hypothetical protein